MTAWLCARVAALCAGACAGARCGGPWALFMCAAALALACFWPRRAIARAIMLYAALGVARGVWVPPSGGVPEPQAVDAHLVITEPVRQHGAWIACRVVTLRAPAMGDARPVRVALLRAPGITGRIGDHVRVRCRVLPQMDLANFGTPRAIRWVRPQDRTVRLAAIGPPRVTHPRPSLRDVPLVVRAWGCRTVAAHMEGPPRDLVLALVWGVHADLPEEWRAAFRATGTTHVLAISGTHLTIVLAVLRVLLRAMRCGPVAAEVAVLACGWVYALAVGAPASVVRAALMHTVATIALLRQIPLTGGEALARAVLWNVLCEPRVLDDVGFQLSVLGTTGLLTASPHLARTLFFGEGPAPSRRWWIRACEPLVTTVWVQALCFGVIAQTFGRVPLTGMLANLPAAPLGGALLVSAVTAHAMSVFAPAIAPFAWAATWAEAHALTMVVGLCARAPGASVRVCPPGPVVLLVLLAAAACACATRGRARAAGAAIMLCVIACACAAPFPHAGSRDVVVRILDVGQGDAILVRTPGGDVIAVDAGDVRGGDMGERVVAPSLLAAGMRRASMLVLTHPHADHAGGIPTLLAEGRIAQLVMSASDTATAVARSIRAAAAARGVRVRYVSAGVVLYDAHGLRIDVLGPSDPPGVPPSDTSSAAVNDRSVVLRVRHGTTRILLTGDAGARAEQEWTDAHGPARCDVLKLGHHGSAGSTSDALLDRVRPRLAVVSAGRGNRFLHPSTKALARCAERGITVWRTDRDGAIEIRSTGGALRVRAARLSVDTPRGRT